MDAGRRLDALVVDLNNFARYPTLSVGYLVAILRRAGIRCTVLSPLARGHRGVRREPRVRPWSLFEQRLRHASALSRSAAVGRTRRVLASLAATGVRRLARSVAEEADARLRARRPDVVLASTYLMYHDACRALGEVCARHGVPLLVGGPYLNHPEVVRAWLDLPGLAGIAGGEVETYLVELIEAAAGHRPLAGFPGVATPASGSALAAAPLKELDAVPFPDFRDFPWDRYPHRIVPLITGRGCGWGVCNFCSDVTSATGRSARSRSLGNVLEEIKQQSATHETRLFAFTDLKLNSHLGVWRGLLDRLPRLLPGARWIAAVHVGSRSENGLSADEVTAAARAGAVRLTTGLESGSQRLLDRMAKGTQLGVTSAFLHAARAAGISVRTTMILGYPGETAADVRASAAFLARHRDAIDRVTLNRFVVMTGTPLDRRQRSSEGPRAARVPSAPERRLARFEDRPDAADDPGYRSAVHELLSEVHHINRRRLPGHASPFDGVM